MPLRGLTIVVADAAPERFRAALTLAAAQAAIGGRARVFCQGAAVALLASDTASPEDARHDAAGLPTLAALRAEALALGVTVVACQSGLHLAGLVASALGPDIVFSGPIEILRTLGDDRLVMA